MLKKIVLIGPESTGKTRLSQKLSEYFKAGWVAEYAREYLLKNGTNYTFENLLDVAKGQLQGEELVTQKQLLSLQDAPKNIVKPEDTLVFIDTDMYVMKVWCEFVFGKCHHWILNKIVERKYDLYLLCNVDLPWVKDELREYPDLISRKKLYHHYKDIMVNQQMPWVDINGNYDERMQKAIDAVKTIL
jgi:NadR type nicotinamide-nucleotide adenylyltransferase